MIRNATFAITEIVTPIVGVCVLVMLFAGSHSDARPPAGVRTAIEQIDKRWSKRVQRAVFGPVLTTPAS